MYETVDILNFQSSCEFLKTRRLIWIAADYFLWSFIVHKTAFRIRDASLAAVLFGRSFKTLEDS